MIRWGAYTHDCHGLSRPLKKMVRNCLVWHAVDLFLPKPTSIAGTGVRLSLLSALLCTRCSATGRTPGAVAGSGGLTGLELVAAPRHAFHGCDDGCSTTTNYHGSCVLSFRMVLLLCRFVACLHELSCYD